MIGGIGWVRLPIVVLSQILGALASAAVVSVLFPGELQVATELGGGTSIAQGLFIEMLLTAQLVFTIIMLAAEKHKGTFLAPIGIGFSLFVSELTGVYFTGGSLNPARSFGPAVVLHSFPGYHWLYWVGPILGAIIAAVFYHLVKILEYETANPGQDFNEKEMDRFAFDEENAATGADVARPDLSSPPLEPTVKGYRGRSVSTRTRPPSASEFRNVFVEDLTEQPGSSSSRSRTPDGRRMAATRPGQRDSAHLSPPGRRHVSSASQ